MKIKTIVNETAVHVGDVVFTNRVSLYIKTVRGQYCD